MNDLLDTVVPIPTEEDVEEQIEEELKTKGFVIDNFRNGTIFKTLVKITIKIYIELLYLARTILKNSYISTAADEWLELKALDYSKQRKAAVKTEGTLTISRITSGTIVNIPKGYIFYALDSNGDKLKYINKETSTLGTSDKSVNISIIAELPGSNYNVSANQITNSLIHIEGVDTITNHSGWISKEGADKESIESLRKRVLNSWADLSSMPIKDKYKNAVEAIPGVLIADIDDNQPRGQGTINITITTPSGTATQNLITQVENAVALIAGPYDNIQVSSATAVETDITVNLIIPTVASDEGLIAQATNVINTYLTSNKTSDSANTLYLSDLNFILRNNLKTVKNIEITEPVTDITLTRGQIIIAGDITVTVERS